MSNKLKRTTVPNLEEQEPTEAVQLTELQRLDLCMKELQALFDRHNVTIVIVARGIKSGTAAPIEDFVNTTHVAELMVVSRK